MKIKIKNKDLPAIIGLGLLFLLLIVTLYVAFPNTQLLGGFSYGIRWQLPFSSTGRIIRKTVGRSTRDLDSQMFYASKGDQILLLRNVKLEEGNIFTSFWKDRFWPPDDVIWSEMVYESTSDTVVIKIEESGFYHFHFRIRKFTGEVEFAWERNE